MFDRVVVTLLDLTVVLLVIKGGKQPLLLDKYSSDLMKNVPGLRFPLDLLHSM